MLAVEALIKFRDMPGLKKVLDVGSGTGEHANNIRAKGIEVLTNSLEAPADLICDFLTLREEKEFCGIWASHVLEHQPNPNLFLQKCFRLLKDNGILAVTVPPAKREVVGGHVTLWNAGTLLYQLILAGFDCSNASVKSYGYNISVIVRKKEAILPALRMDCGDIERLAKFFPMKVEQGFNGEIKEINWI